MLNLFTSFHGALVGLLAVADPNDFYIEKINTGGKGCPGPDSIATVISADGETFVLLYSQMELENPPGPKVKSTSCKAEIHLHVGAGWKVSLTSVNTRGYAYLEQGIKARQTTRYFFSGVPVGGEFPTDLQGPFDDFYEFTDDVPARARVWSKCGAPGILRLDTSLTLDAGGNPGGQAIFNTTTSDGRFAKVLHWDRKRC